VNVNVNVAIVASNVNVAGLNTFVRYAGNAIANALAAVFAGLSLYVAPAPATSTSWATPGAIAGVVIAGVVAIVLIVLLSVFIPRIQHYQQAQVFGQGFQPQQQQQQMQMQQQVPPGAFFASPQHMEMGGKVVSF